jgi:hypothetical protein
MLPIASWPGLPYGTRFPQGAVLIAASVGCLATSARTDLSSVARGSSRPNIVVIYADNLDVLASRCCGSLTNSV